MAPVTLAATQTACDWDRNANIDRVEALVRKAAAAGAGIVLPQELFETPYFCKDQEQRFFDLAHPAKGHPVIERFASLARSLGIVIPVSFFERANTAYYNSVAMIDADGSVLGVYRKSHIPDGPGYQEKFYFNPGDTGFKVFRTRFGAIGCAICWDQWFPESARAMALMGAEILMYPTAIGSEPQDPELDSSDHWTRVMQGHAGANMMPLVASNRIGRETGNSCETTFYGSSFIAGAQGELLAQASRDREEIVTATVDLDAIRRARASWGVFRDRRPDLYGPLTTLDGRLRHPAHRFEQDA
ncbi:N-carbamoylputrescine amidase [Fodinicurvata sp. EGI_FJ10296]|uniref:N-carbamoylputrescine amidase n=1 Tax=Fodinicurvata sp. EGI_FJ10296 TaxID=3231908 RepID=UPI003455F5EE